MLNFTQGIKREILSTVPKDDCCKLAYFCALLDTCGSVNSACVEFASENERIAEYFFAISEALDLPPELNGATYDARSKKERIQFCLKGESAKMAYKLYTEWNVEELERHCAVSYVRGVFLGGGSCSIPHEGAKSGYHLEFALPSEETAERFCIVFQSLMFYTKVIKRGEKFVIYLKSREAVSEVLTAIGVKGALKELETVLIEREKNNLNNRVGNCMARNTDKSMTASAEQAHFIRKLKGSAHFIELPETLKELAEERLNDPTLSLNELAIKLNVSKSCLNHRMRKLMEICRRTEET